MKLSDEVIVKMLEAAHGVGVPASSFTTYREAMRRAAEVLVPVVLEEALADPTEDEWIAINVFADSEFGGYLSKFLRVRRLARLTAKPDAAVEAVLGLQLGKGIPWKIENRETAEQIVAAVDQARGEQ